MTDAEILAAARAWCTDDPDPATKAAAEALVAKGDPAVLRDHFGARLQFGTAGLRGALGPGPNRMNRALVRRVTAGLGSYLLEHVGDAAGKGVVVGRDGRHGSPEFAEDVDTVLAGAGIRVWFHEQMCPTPVLAHAVVHLRAAAGVMVTASHNPPQDNGYKVYWSDGAQIIPPHDHGISARIDTIRQLAGVPIPDFHPARRDGRIKYVSDDVFEAYLEKVLALRVHRETGAKIVYTAMHGVGARSIRRVLHEAGHDDLHFVAAQVDPDPAFPTVKFPNPEEPGALNLATTLARVVGADVIIANDPDADRLAVAARERDDNYKPLSGNQIGVLLAADLLENGPGENGGRRMVATSVVSSRMLETVANAMGVAYADTLTGFKWIAAEALKHEAAGGRFVFGYEEALGYSAGTVVRDKDGVSAALLLADLASHPKARGETLFDRLEALYRQYGYFASAQRSLTLPGASGRRQIEAIMALLRERTPTELGGAALTRFRDLEKGVDKDIVAGTTGTPTLPTSDVLHFQYGPDIRVLARPSGTEPKLKIYFEVRDTLALEESLHDGIKRVGERVDDIATELMALVKAVTG